MTGDHPNPLRRRSKLLLRDPTALRLRHRVGKPQSGMAHTVVPALPAAIRLDHKLGHWSPSSSTLKKSKAKRAVKSCLRPTSAANAPRFASYEDAPAPAGYNGRRPWNMGPLAPSAGTAIIQAAEWDGYDQRPRNLCSTILAARQRASVLSEAPAILMVFHDSLSRQVLCASLYRILLWGIFHIKLPSTPVLEPWSIFWLCPRL